MENAPQASSEDGDPLPSGAERGNDNDETRRRGMVPRLGDVALTKIRNAEGKTHEAGPMHVAVQAVAAELSRTARRAGGESSIA